jgi:hypothetical protein
MHSPGSCGTHISLSQIIEASKKQRRI